MSHIGEHIWIVGASSGIGKALAQELAAQGATLILSARREDELDALNQELGGEHHVQALDISDVDQVQAVAKTIATTCPKLDRVIVMAALYRPDSIANMELSFAASAVEVNLLGSIYVTHAVLPLFARQKEGQIVLCGSVAGYMGLPNGQPYSATKAAVISFAESLYAEVDKSIDVKVINPGFVRTPMTDRNDFPMPMRIEPEEAAKAIAQGLTQKGFEIHFPKRFTLWLKLLHLLPYSVSLFITRKM